MEDYNRLSSSNLGRIKSFKKYRGINERILKQRKNNNGYFKVGLSKNGQVKTKFVHTLVFETFSDYKLKDDECVHHIDFIQENNYFETLEVMSKKEHIKLHMGGENNTNFGRFGEKSLNHKLTGQENINIKSDIEKGNLTQIEIAKKYGVSQATISYIKTGKIRY